MSLNLLKSNVQWATAVTQKDLGFFPKSAQGQSPQTLWIGCADSRVPESVITASKPGDIFVHRNIANQFLPDDVNALAVLDYAVNFLGVEHVIVVGHSECGGASASLDAIQRKDFDPNGPVVTIPSLPPSAALNRWLEPLTRLAGKLDIRTTSRDKALSLVVSENVKMQIDNLCQTQTIRDAWTVGTPKGQSVSIHGCVYDLATGRLQDLKVTRVGQSRLPL